MKYGVVWKHTAGNGSVQRLMAHPESLEEIDTVEKAQEEGRRTLAELAPQNKSGMMPLSVVELNDQMTEELDKCPLIELDGEDEMIFINVDELSFWALQPWWSR